MTTWLVLDVSPSMAFGTAERLKWDVAEGVIRVLGRLATRRGGRVALLTCGGPVRPPARAAQRPRRRRRAGARAGRGGRRRRPRRRAGRRRRPRAHGPPDQARRAWSSSSPTSAGRSPGAPRCAHWASATRCSPLRSPIPREASLPDVGRLALIDPETGTRVEVDTRDSRLRRALRAARARAPRGGEGGPAPRHRPPRGAVDGRAVARRTGARAGVNFDSPVYLLALLAIPLALAAYALAQRRRRSFAVRHPGVPALAELVGTTPFWRRHLPAALFAAALAVLAVALARPEATVAVAEEQRGGGAGDRRVGLDAGHRRRPSRLAADTEGGTHLPRGRARASCASAPSASPARWSPCSAPARTATGSRPSSTTWWPTAAPPPAKGSRTRSTCSTMSGRTGKKRPPAAIVLLSDGKTTLGRDPVEVAREAQAAQDPDLHRFAGHQRGRGHRRSLRPASQRAARPGHHAPHRQASGGRHSRSTRPRS